MKRNRKYNKNLAQENLMNGLRHIVILLGIGVLFAQDCPEGMTNSEINNQEICFVRHA